MDWKIHRKSKRIIQTVVLHVEMFTLNLKTMQNEESRFFFVLLFFHVIFIRWNIYAWETMPAFGVHHTAKWMRKKSRIYSTTKTKPTRTHKPSCHHAEWKKYNIFLIHVHWKRIQWTALWSWTSSSKKNNFKTKIKPKKRYSRRKENKFLLWLESVAVQIFFILAAVEISLSKIHTSLIATTPIASKPKYQPEIPSNSVIES